MIALAVIGLVSLVSPALGTTGTLAGTVAAITAAGFGLF